MWQLLTITHPAEAAQARWDELDLEAREWKIPASRMKMNRDHTVPNDCSGDGEAVKQQPGIYLFQPYQAKPTNEQPNRQCITKRADFGGVLVSHGLSYIASTAFNEQGFPPDVIEAALVHVDKNEVRYAYNCSDYLEQHRPMMYMVG